MEWWSVILFTGLITFLICSISYVFGVFFTFGQREANKKILRQSERHQETCTCKHEH